MSWLPNPFRVVIVGGGISGLSAAHTILKHSKVPTEVTLLESQRHIGGWLQSTRFEDGTVFEHGPRSARSYGATATEALSLLSDLDIDNKIVGVSKKTAAASRRYIYAKGDVRELPSGWKVALRQEFLSKSLLSYAIKEPFTKKSQLADETVHEFFRRRFRSQEIADYFADPLCRGIFGGDSKKLSIRSCFPMLYDYEQQHGSIVKGVLFTKTAKSNTEGKSLVRRAKDGNWMAWTLQNGIQTLPEIWMNYLTGQGLTVLLNTCCESIKSRTKDNKLECLTNAGVIEADRVIATVPTYKLSEILKEEDEKLSSYLASVKYADMAVVTLEYENETVSQQGFGYLVPSCEPLDILGVTFDSQVFPHLSPKNSTILTVMTGGERFNELFGDPLQADTGRITELATRTVRDTLKIKEEPSRFITRIQRQCIPQYQIGHYTISQKIVKHLKSYDIPITILGNAWGGAGVNDAIVNARNETLKWLASNHMY